MRRRVSLRTRGADLGDDGPVSTEIAEPPLSVADAARARSEALGRVRRTQDAYNGVRAGASLARMDSARTAWGLATLELIDALVAEAEAEDRRDPVLAAHRAQRVRGLAGPAFGAYQRVWSDYQEVRSTGDLAAMDAARSSVRLALVDWMQDRTARAAAEDQQHVAELFGRLDQADRLDPRDAFPVKPASRARQIVIASRERERQASLRRDRARDGY